MIKNPILRVVERRKRSEEERIEEPEPGERSSVARSAAIGLVGGFVGTLVMTAFRLPIARSLPPTAEFWAKYVGGGDPEEYPAIGLALHLLYGIGAGGVAGALFPAVADRLPGEREETHGVVWGVLYGLPLSAFGSRVVLGRLLEMDLEPDESLIFHVSHLIYGLTLGAWIGSRQDAPILPR